MINNKEKIFENHHHYYLIFILLFFITYINCGKIPFDYNLISINKHMIVLCSVLFSFLLVSQIVIRGLKGQKWIQLGILGSFYVGL